MPVMDTANDLVLVYDADVGDYGQATINALVQAALQGAAGVNVTITGGKVDIEIDSAVWLEQVNSLPLADGVDPTVDFVAIHDATQGLSAKIPMDNLPFGAGYDGSYTTVQLAAIPDAQAGDTAYGTGLPGGGGTEGLVYFDGTNWRKVRNNIIVA